MVLEVVVAFGLAILFLAVFNAPLWLIKLGSFGGLGFAFFVMILVAKWLIGYVRRQPVRQ